MKNLEQELKLTEDETVGLLMKHLTNDGWQIDSHCLGQSHGCDIIASKFEKKLLIEVKGARAGNEAPTKKREYFDSGQIKSHFGRAIVKSLEDKYKNPKARFAIAHPDDPGIRKVIGHLTPYLKTLGIKHYWVSSNGNVVED